MLAGLSIAATFLIAGAAGPCSPKETDMDSCIPDKDLPESMQKLPAETYNIILKAGIATGTVFNFILTLVVMGVSSYLRHKGEAESRRLLDNGPSSDYSSVGIRF